MKKYSFLILLAVLALIGSCGSDATSTTNEAVTNSASNTSTTSSTTAAVNPAPNKPSINPDGTDVVIKNATEADLAAGKAVQDKAIEAMKNAPKTSGNPLASTSDKTSKEEALYKKKMKQKLAQEKAKKDAALKKANEKKDAAAKIKEPAMTTSSAPVVETAVPDAPIEEEPAIIDNDEIVEMPDVISEPPPPPAPPSFNHDIWNVILMKNVHSSGTVNYAWMKNDLKKLDVYIRLLQNNTPQSSWSKNKKLAYWINVYNAHTVKLIVDNYPVNSIKDLEGGKPWDKKWIKIGGSTYSLNNIENDIIRPKFNDPRIHFAVNCAAKSCPQLMNAAFTETNLNTKLDKMTKKFVNNSQFNSIDSKNIEVSKIFEWYAADFGDLITFLNKYSDTKINAGAKINYKEYDWNLNK